MLVINSKSHSFFNIRKFKFPCLAISLFLFHYLNSMPNVIQYAKRVKSAQVFVFLTELCVSMCFESFFCAIFEEWWGMLIHFFLNLFLYLWLKPLFNSSWAMILLPIVRRCLFCFKSVSCVPRLRVNNRQMLSEQLSKQMNSKKLLQTIHVF